MNVDKDQPIYPISVAAKLLAVHPRTLRIYEDEGLLKPARQGNKRFFSTNDIEWVRCIRKLIHTDGISIPGVKKLLELTPCWEIRNCLEETRNKCTAFRDRTVPCWQQVNTACSNDSERCLNCDVYVQAMGRAAENNRN